MKRGCGTGPPRWESIPGLLKRSTNTGSVPMVGALYLNRLPTAQYTRKLAVGFRTETKNYRLAASILTVCNTAGLGYLEVIWTVLEKVMHYHAVEYELSEW